MFFYSKIDATKFQQNLKDLHSYLEEETTKTDKYYSPWY